MSVKLIATGTAVPPHLLLQRDAAAAAHQGFASRYDDFERLARVFENSGIRQRFTVRPLEWYLEPLDWPARNAAYLAGATQLHPGPTSSSTSVASTAASAALVWPNGQPVHHFTSAVVAGP
jgi:alkylresorcinol/alkylpyrone synthase